MANAVSIPVSEELMVLVTRVTAAYVYENRQRTEKRVTNDLGQPLTRITGLSVLLSDFREVTLEVPDHLAQDVSLRQLILVSGVNAKAEMTARDFDMAVKIKGIEEVRALYSDIVPLWETLIKDGAES